MNSAISIGEPWMWGAFIGFVLVMLALDLFVFGGRKAHKVGVKEAATWSLVWVSLALLFNAGLWWHLNGTFGTEICGGDMCSKMCCAYVLCSGCGFGGWRFCFI